MKPVLERTSDSLRQVLVPAAGILFGIIVYGMAMAAARHAAERFEADSLRVDGLLQAGRSLEAKESAIAASYAKETAAEKKETGGDALKRIEALAVKAGAVVKDLRKNADGTVTLEAEAAPDSLASVLFALKDSGLCKVLMSLEVVPTADAKAMRAVVRAALYGSGDVL